MILRTEAAVETGTCGETESHRARQSAAQAGAWDHHRTATALCSWSGGERCREVVTCEEYRRASSRQRQKQGFPEVDRRTGRGTLDSGSLRKVVHLRTNGEWCKEKYNGNTRWTRPRHTLPDEIRATLGYQQPPRNQQESLEGQGSRVWW